jgi:hypothetical protein
LRFSHAALQDFGADQAFFRDRRVFWKSIQETEVSGAFCGGLEDFWVFCGFDADYLQIFYEHV